jgi:hypothetical protein
MYILLFYMRLKFISYPPQGQNHKFRQLPCTFSVHGGARNLWLSIGRDMYVIVPAVVVFFLARNIRKEYSRYVPDVVVEVLPSRQPAIVSIHERDMSYLALTAMDPKPALHVIVMICSTVSIRPPQGRSGRSRLDGPMHLLGVVKRDYMPFGTVSVPPCSWGPLTCARTQPCTGRTSVL